VVSRSIRNAMAEDARRIAPVAFQLRGVLGIGARGRRAALRPDTREAVKSMGAAGTDRCETHPARVREADWPPRAPGRGTAKPESGDARFIAPTSVHAFR